MKRELAAIDNPRNRVFPRSCGFSGIISEKTRFLGPRDRTFGLMGDRIFGLMGDRAIIQKT